MILPMLSGRSKSFVLAVEDATRNCAISTVLR
jgi:hypothetical protein